MLLNSVVNLLQHVSWQLQMNDKAPLPEPFLLPGLSRPRSKGDLRGDLVSIEEADRRLGWNHMKR